MSKQKVVILSPFPISEEARERWRRKFPNFDFIFHLKTWGEPRAVETVPDEDWKKTVALFTPSALPAPEQVPKLQFVQLSSAGANMIINHPLYKDTNITFTSAKGAYDPQIAEWAVSTFIGVRHHLYRYHEQQKQRLWNRILDPVPSSVGQTVGILGYGSIGRQVARVSQALGIKVHAYTLHPKNTPESRRSESGLADNLGDPEGTIPEKWYSDLDWLLISVPLTAKTKHLIAREELQVLSKKRAFISNIARGPIVQTDDLVEALENGSIAGAALDVTDPEPLPKEHPLWNAPNTIITPHISAFSTAAPDRVLRIFEYNLEQLVAGKKLINIIDRKENY
ncbi:D-isomer specific 2-hydroxyacid dehydrogenase [Penicillium chermesinum]|nr:D-isomer specific 2-hydroxyacid dehydrogenase [Penicillium chermesinum]